MAQTTIHLITTYMIVSIGLWSVLLQLNGQTEALPLVERVDKEDGNFLGVHVPLFYDMSLDRKNTTGESTMNINVLSGLVRIFRDRVKGSDGKYTGPLTVSVLGTPVYDNTRTKAGSGTGSGAQTDTVESNEISSSPNSAHNTIVNGGNSAVPIVGDIFSRIGEMLQSLAKPVQQAPQLPHPEASLGQPASVGSRP